MSITTPFTTNTATLNTVRPPTPPTVGSVPSGSHGGFIFRFGSPAVTTDDNNVEGVGLSDPTKTHNRKEMLDLVNRLRNTGYESSLSDICGHRLTLIVSIASVQTDIDLPLIAVIGSQSAGKSSLIESISGITLPRSSGTCTRYVRHSFLASIRTHVRAIVDVLQNANCRIRIRLGNALSNFTSAQTQRACPFPFVSFLLGIQ
jgi:hypothetical protein